MSDLRLAFDGLETDLVLEDDDVARDEGLETAILISLFTDRWVDQAQLPQGETDPRGWWADLLNDDPSDEIGSRLWTLARAKPTGETLESAREFATEALQWLLDDGIASAVAVTTEYPERGRMSIGVNVTRPSGDTGRFRFVWTMSDAA